jgi:hypothetical protein
MRTFRISSLALALSALLASAAARADGVQHHVSVGGHDQDPTGHTDANFSLVAILYGDGHASGQWTDQFGQGQGGIHVEVNCVFVAGNEAWISGIIKHGNVNGADLSGLPVITRVQDNGKSANDPPDAISFSFIGNATPCTAAPALPLFPMTDGQVSVR